MNEFGSILVVVIILWTTLILYIVHLDSNARDMGKRISDLERLLKK